jgi:hypothetical protein
VELLGVRGGACRPRRHPLGSASGVIPKRRTPAHGVAAGFARVP